MSTEVAIYKTSYTDLHKPSARPETQPVNKLNVSLHALIIQMSAVLIVIYLDKMSSYLKFKSHKIFYV
jgi:hypothetical protein